MAPSPPKSAAWSLPGNGTLPAYAHGPMVNVITTGGPPPDPHGAGAPAAPDARKVVVLG